VEETNEGAEEELNPEEIRELARANPLAETELVRTRLTQGVGEDMHEEDDLRRIFRELAETKK